MTRIWLIFCFLLMTQSSQIFACFCAPSPFCNYNLLVNQYQETSLIFMGSFLQEDTLVGGQKAVQFKVEELYRGTIITPESPFFTGETYENTDSTVWILSGPDESCLRYITKETAIFAVLYNYEFPSSGSTFGYSPSSCFTDYFPISPDGKVTGKIWDEIVSLPVEELEELIETNCNTSNIADEIIFSWQTKIRPNPCRDYAFIESSHSLENVDITIVNSSGLVIRKQEGPDIDLEHLGPGLYFIRFQKGSLGYMKRLIKI